MASFYDFYLNALLADSAYALNEDAIDGASGDALDEFLLERMTRPLAGFVSNNFSVVTHMETDDDFGSGFDATVWKEKSSGKLYVSMRGRKGCRISSRTGRFQLPVMPSTRSPI